MEDDPTIVNVQDAEKLLETLSDVSRMEQMLQFMLNEQGRVMY